ncbi:MULTISPECIES: hypothetical protein [Corynebacterium]|uniref:hypothetical protein n=1 Tax=Corynebacterium TaxID=1716 RepID=UPI00195AF58F|nr:MULTISPECIES: hypothetical protein [Corynebacterium]QRQ65078.1 hypothetical protein I6J23_00800 [Corynebacterium kroppenstedtii]
MRPKDSLKTAQYGGDVAQSCLAVRKHDAIKHDAIKHDAIKNDLVGGSSTILWGDQARSYRARF